MGDPEKIQISLVKSIGLSISYSHYNQYQSVSLGILCLLITINFGQNRGGIGFYNELGE